MKVSILETTGGELVDTTSADRWFAALDQRRVGGANSWVIQVHGVHCEQDGFWIQLSSTEDPFTTIVLHLAPTTPIGDVLAAIEGHDRSSDGRPAMIDLAGWATRVSISPTASRLLQPRPVH